MAAVVIADASPLIALARVDGLSWLRALFGDVLVTTVVVQEVLTGDFPATEAPTAGGGNSRRDRHGPQAWPDPLGPGHL